MFRKALPLLVIVAVAGMMGLLALGLVVAQQAGISRSLPAGPVAPDDAFAVTINNVGLADGFGSVVETLPAGFNYVDNSAASTDANAVIDAVVAGQTVTFTVVGVDSFTYRVTVGSDVADGPYTFSGVLKKLSGTESIGGDNTVTVGAGDGTITPPVTTTPPSGGGRQRSYDYTRHCHAYAYPDANTNTGANGRTGDTNTSANGRTGDINTCADRAGGHRGTRRYWRARSHG